MGSKFVLTICILSIIELSGVVSAVYFNAYYEPFKAYILCKWSCAERPNTPIFCENGSDRITALHDEHVEYVYKPGILMKEFCHGQGIKGVCCTSHSVLLVNTNFDCETVWNRNNSFLCCNYSILIICFVQKTKTFATVTWKYTMICSSKRTFQWLYTTINN